MNKRVERQVRASAWQAAGFTLLMGVVVVGVYALPSIVVEVTKVLVP